MKNGRIAADGTPDAIMCSEVLEEIYGFSVPVVEAGGMRLALQYAGVG